MREWVCTKDAMRGLPFPRCAARKVAPIAVLRERYSGAGAPESPPNMYSDSFGNKRERFTRIKDCRISHSLIHFNMGKIPKHD